MRRVLFSTIALFALLFTSCEVLNPTEEKPAMEGKFHITSESLIEMPAEGGYAEIEYVIDTAVEGAVLTATSTSEWISDIEVGDKISFLVDANSDITERLGSITLRYASATVVVGVEQKGRTVSDDATLTITSERTMSFGPFGGEGTITYTLTGSEEGDKPTVECNQAWVENIVVDFDKIDFVVTENTSTNIRRANITIAYGEIKNAVQIKQEAHSSDPVLTANRTSVKPGETIEFRVTIADTDVTASSKIYDYYTKSEITNPYTPSEVAERVFYAKYNDFTSNVMTVNVIPSNAPDFPADTAPESYDFNQRMLIVDHTGAGCSYCPAVKEVFKAAEENPEYNYKFNPVYSYSFSSGELCYSSAAKTLWNYYVNVCKTGDQLTGFPSFTTNYLFNWTGKFNLEQRIDEHWVETPSASIALAANRDGNKLTVSAAVKSSKSQSIKLSLWLLEDDIYATQSGATASWMHTHHNVMRDALTGISSSDIAGIDFGFVSENSTLERVMSFDLFVANSWNIENCKLIAIISAPDSNYNNQYEVVNTAICEFGGSVGFDYKR